MCVASFTGNLYLFVFRSTMLISHSLEVWGPKIVECCTCLWVFYFCFLYKMNVPFKCYIWIINNININNMINRWVLNMIDIYIKWGDTCFVVISLLLVFYLFSLSFVLLQIHLTLLSEIKLCLHKIGVLFLTRPPRLNTDHDQYLWRL